MELGNEQRKDCSTRSVLLRPIASQQHCAWSLVQVTIPQKDLVS